MGIFTVVSWYCDISSHVSSLLTYLPAYTFIEVQWYLSQKQAKKKKRRKEDKKKIYIYIQLEQNLRNKHFWDSRHDNFLRWQDTLHFREDAL